MAKNQPRKKPRNIKRDITTGAGNLSGNGFSLECKFQPHKPGKIDLKNVRLRVNLRFVNKTENPKNAFVQVNESECPK